MLFKQCCHPAHPSLALHRWEVAPAAVVEGGAGGCDCALDVRLVTAGGVRNDSAGRRVDHRERRSAGGLNGLAVDQVTNETAP